MIITVVCDVLGQENNGTTIACMNLIRSLKAKNHEVRVVCMDKDKVGQPGWYIVPEVNLGVLNRIFYRNGVSLARADEKVLEDAIRDCDIVHTTFVLGLSVKAIEIAHKFHKPVTASFHCQAENITVHVGLKNVNWANKLVYKYYKKHVFGCVEGIHYPTQFIRDVYESIAGPTNGYVISNGVNKTYHPMQEDKPEELKDKFVILSIGRLCGEKNQDILMKAIGKSKYKDQIYLMLAGKGPNQKKLAKLGNKLGLHFNISFYSHDELAKIINYADLYCHPAEVEIESISCLEAITCGIVPIIANSKKSAAKAFALYENCLFKNKDSSDLASKIDYWISNPEEKEKCAKAYLDSSISFDQDVCMDAMENMMKDVYRRWNDEGKESNLLQK